MDIQREFWRRLKEEWLPAYCNDPARRYDIAGFRADAADDGVISPLHLDGATLIESDKSFEQFAQCHPLALTIYTLQVADSFSVSSLCNLAIRCA